MPRLRNNAHIVDLNSRLSYTMTQRLYELNGSSVINLLNTKVIYILSFYCEREYRFGYDGAMLRRYINGEKEQIRVRRGEEHPFINGGIGWNLVTDIELEDDTLVFYQR